MHEPQVWYQILRLGARADVLHEPFVARLDEPR